MESLLKTVIGFLLLGLSLGYLYRPGLVLKVNQLFRDILFNDAYVLHYRRRWGMPLFVAAVVFLYSGMANYRSENDERMGVYNQMNEAYRAYYLKDYTKTRIICDAILAVEPNDPHAQFLLRQSQRAKEEAALLISTAPLQDVPHRP